MDDLPEGFSPATSTINIIVEDLRRHLVRLHLGKAAKPWWWCEPKGAQSLCYPAQALSWIAAEYMNTWWTSPSYIQHPTLFQCQSTPRTTGLWCWPPTSWRPWRDSSWSISAPWSNHTWTLVVCLPAQTWSWRSPTRVFCGLSLDFSLPATQTSVSWLCD